MSIICPTLDAEDAHAYREQVERVAPFAQRVHIDLGDGIFTPNRLINPIQAWWPEGAVADIHVMYADPVSQIQTLISLQPHLVIIHAEAGGDLLGMILHLKKFQLKTGVALLKATIVETVRPLIEATDHVLLFSGELGYFGGHADMKVLEKLSLVRAINPDVEVGWDGGANASNVRQLADGGVDVINVGGAIHKAADPEAAYRAMEVALQA